MSVWLHAHECVAHECVAARPRVWPMSVWLHAHECVARECVAARPQRRLRLVGLVGLIRRA